MYIPNGMKVIAACPSRASAYLSIESFLPADAIHLHVR